MIFIALRRPTFRLAIWMMLVPAVISGMFSLLGPLRLSQFGAGATVIGVVYAIAAAAETFISPQVGKLSDRHGRVRSLRVSLCLIAALLLIFTLPDTVVLVAAMIVCSMVAIGSFWAPSMALVSDVAHSSGVEHALAAAFTNLGWAGGQLLGSVLGGAAAETAGDAVPMVAAAGLCVLTLLMLSSPRITDGLESAQQLSSGS